MRVHTGPRYIISSDTSTPNKVPTVWPKIKLRAGIDAFWSQWTVHIVLWLTVKIWPQKVKILCCFEVDFRLFQGLELHSWCT